jgi:MFS family permease
VSVVALVRRDGFRELLIGQTVSALGDWMGTFAFMALALSLTGSSAAVGGILALRLLPAALGGPLAARAANRWDRRKTMVAMDLVRAGMIAAVPLVRGLWWIYIWAFSIEVASIVFLPARDAAIPDLVPEGDLPVANGLVLGSSYGTIPLGAAAFAILAAIPGATIFGRSNAVVFWVDGATFLVSALFIARLTILGRPAPESEETSASTDEPSGFLAAFSIPLVRAVMPAAAAVAIGLGALFSLGIVFVREVLGASDAEFGVLIALFGIGAVVGLAALQRWRGGDPLMKTRAGVMAIGAIVACFSLAPAVGFAFLGAVGFGAAAAFTLACGMGALQSMLDGTERVLAFAAFHVVIRVGLAVSAIAAGVAGDIAASVNWPLVGRLEPSRMVLLASGVLVGLSSLLVTGRAPEHRRDLPYPPGIEG